jgi:hypothetical protein
MSQRDPFDQEESRLAAALQSLPGPAPSAELDQRILAAAREAVRPQQRRRSPHAWRWSGAVAAAVVALALAPQWWRGEGEFAPVPTFAPSADEVLREEVQRQAPRADAGAARSGTRPTEGLRKSETELQPDTAEPPVHSLAPPAPAPAPASPPPAAALSPSAAADTVDQPSLPASDLATHRSRGSRRELETEARELPPAAATLGNLAKRRATPQPAEPSSAASVAREASTFADQAQDEASSALQEVRKLRQQGLEEDAEAALRALIKEFPQLDIPEDLRDLLDEPSH